MTKQQLINKLSIIQDELLSNVKNGGNYDFQLENELLGKITNYLIVITENNQND